MVMFILTTLVSLMNALCGDCLERSFYEIPFYFALEKEQQTKHNNYAIRHCSINQVNNNNNKWPIRHAHFPFYKINDIKWSTVNNRRL
jgi:hypothetical protein